MEKQNKEQLLDKKYYFQSSICPIWKIVKNIESSDPMFSSNVDIKWILIVFEKFGEYNMNWEKMSEYVTQLRN